MVACLVYNELITRGIVDSLARGKCDALAHLTNTSSTADDIGSISEAASVALVPEGEAAIVDAVTKCHVTGLTQIKALFEAFYYDQTTFNISLDTLLRE